MLQQNPGFATRDAAGGVAGCASSRLYDGINSDAALILAAARGMHRCCRPRTPACHPALPARANLPTRKTTMVVRAGREFLAIPGPTTMPDEVLRAMHRPALDIYSDTMVGLTDSLLRDLANLFVTKGQAYIYIANGHGAWEA